MSQLIQELTASRQVIITLGNQMNQARNFLQQADIKVRNLEQQNRTCRNIIESAKVEINKIAKHDQELEIALRTFTRDNSRLSQINSQLGKENNELAVRAIGKEIAES